MTLARQSAAAWRAVRGDAFNGAVTIETTNRVYRFEDAVFAGRAGKAPPGAETRWETPPEMAGAELVGFLANEGGLWSLSTRWRPHVMAVLTTNNRTFTLTSPTSAFSVRAAPEEPPPPASGTRRRPSSSPPGPSRPTSPSLTRAHATPQIPFGSRLSFG